MYAYNFIYRVIRLRISHSYETFMDNTFNQRDIHFQVLDRRFNPEFFNNLRGEVLNEILTQFLYDLQSEVDCLVGHFNGEDYY